MKSKFRSDISKSKERTHVGSFNSTKSSLHRSFMDSGINSTNKAASSFKIDGKKTDENK